jgi:hypothetical protein
LNAALAKHGYQTKLGTWSSDSSKWYAPMNRTLSIYDIKDQKNSKDLSIEVSRDINDPRSPYRDRDRYYQYRNGSGRPTYYDNRYPE